MNLKKLITFNFSISFILFAFSSEFSRFGIPISVTGNRIGLLLLFMNINLFWMLKKRIVVNKNIVIPFFITITLGIITTLSYVNSSFQNETSISTIITWFLISIMIFSLSFIFKKDLLILDYFYKTVISVNFIIVIYIIILLITNEGLNWFLFAREGKSFLNSYLPRGINRFLNGLFIISSFSIYHLFYRIKKIFEFKFILLSFVNSIFYLFLSSWIGSRQSIINLVVYVFVLIALNIFSFKKMKIKTFLRYTIIIFLFFIIMVSLGLDDIIISRFSEIKFSMESQSEPNIRIKIWKDAFILLVNNYIFGIGPGVYPKISPTGFHAHNGFITLLLSAGIVGISILFYYLANLMIDILQPIFIRKNLSDDFYKIFISIFIALLAANLFNDLLIEYIFWYIVVITIFSKNRLMKGWK